jgi:hypothetical protein
VPPEDGQVMPETCRGFSLKKGESVRASKSVYQVGFFYYITMMHGEQNIKFRYFQYYTVQHMTLQSHTALIRIHGKPSSILIYFVLTNNFFVFTKKYKHSHKVI